MKRSLNKGGIVRKAFLYFFGIFCLLVSVRNDVSAADGAVIEKIDYKFDDESVKISNALIDSHIQLRVGQEFSPLLADASVKSLYSSGMFDNIVVKANENPTTRGCIVTFVLTPRVRIAEVNFAGNDRISSRSLRKKISTKVGDRVSDGALVADACNIVRFYNDKGFMYAEATPRIERQQDSPDARVFFDITEGEKLKIGKIRFPGNDVIKDDELLKIMRTKEWKLWYIFGKAGVYRSPEFAADLADLRSKFWDHGYLDVEIDENKVVYQKRGNRIDVDIHVVLGKRYSVGSIVVKGNKLHSTEEIMSLLTFKQGDIFSPSAIDGSADSIRDLYGKEGYVSTVVNVDRRPRLDADVINLVVNIKESSKCFVNDIEIHGNLKTKNKVILRELLLAPGDTFNTVDLRISRERLLGTGFFSSVNITPIDTPDPAKKDLIIDVKEANTGMAKTGGGVSLGGEPVAFAEFSQSNFDINSSNKKFQGGGQKFRARVQAGQHTQSLDINFEEPWFYDRELAVGTDLFFERTNFSKSFHNYAGASFDETRVGAEFYVRKRLYELWVGRLAYHIENVNVRHISRNSPKCFFDEEGNTSVSKVIFTTYRDTRNDWVHPTVGSNITLSTELAGGPCFGETKYIKLSSSASRHWLVFNEPEQVLSVLGEIGTITPYGGDTVPFFDRYYLGGSQQMKGFRTRDIGPNEKDTGIGGNSMAYATAEYSVRIFDPVRVYGFAEVGYVNESKWNFSTRRYNTDVGIGCKIDIMKFPLNLSFGFPVHGERNNKHGMRFNFSFAAAF